MKKLISPDLFTNQPKIDFSQLHHIENKVSNQEHFEANKEKFSNQCKIVYEALLRGERLTTKKAMLNYDIWHLPRRIKDLIDEWGVPIESQVVEGNFKEYYLTTIN